MRLWHQLLLPILPNNQLTSQHRECCALRGLGWGKNHSTVNYVFSYSRYKLYQYHLLVMDEMVKRNPLININQNWISPYWCGDKVGNIPPMELFGTDDKIVSLANVLYPEHDNKYYRDCLINLIGKLQVKYINLCCSKGIMSKDTLATCKEMVTIMDNYDEFKLKNGDDFDE